MMFTKDQRKRDCIKGRKLIFRCAHTITRTEVSCRNPTQICGAYHVNRSSPLRNARNVELIRRKQIAKISRDREIHSAQKTSVCRGQVGRPMCAIASVGVASFVRFSVNLGL